VQRKRITNKDVERFPVLPEDKAKSHPILWDGADGSVKGFGMRYSARTGTQIISIFTGRHDPGEPRC
jgi:hypothetical protein